MEVGTVTVLHIKLLVCGICKNKDLMCRSRNLFLLSLSAAQLGKCSAFIATTTTSTLHHVRRGSISAKSTVLQSALFSIAPTATDIATKSSSVLSPSVVLERVFEDDNRPIILFDGVCNLCNNAVNLALGELHV